MAALSLMVEGVPAIFKVPFNPNLLWFCEMLMIRQWDLGSHFGPVTLLKGFLGV